MKRFTYFESTESRIGIRVRLCHWSIVSGVHLPLDKGKIQRDELHVAGLQRTIYRLTSCYGASVRITDGFLNAAIDFVKRFFLNFFKDQQVFSQKQAANIQKVIIIFKAFRQKITLQILRLYRAQSMTYSQIWLLSPLFRQQVVSLSQSSCVSPVELTDRRGGRWQRRSQIIRRQESLALYISFNTLCSIEHFQQ